MINLIDVGVTASSAVGGGLLGGFLAHLYLHRDAVKVKSIENMVSRAPEIITKLGSLLIQVLETAKVVKTISK